MTHHRSCLQSLKVLEIGSSAWENLILALEHGADLVAGIDSTEFIVESARSRFEKKKFGINPDKFSFIRANIFSYEPG